MVENGAVIEFGTDKKPGIIGRVSSGDRFVDQTGAVVPEIVTRDRLQLTETGFLIIVATIDRHAKLVSSLDIVTRGFIASKTNVQTMNGIRAEIRKILSAKKEVRSKTAIELLKRSIQMSVGSYLLHETGGLPIIIPVVNVIGVTRNHRKPADEVH
jgi:ribonuclease J